jgi:hypothetical protein
MADQPGGRGSRERVRARANGLCEYCRSQERFATAAFSIEHIVPAQAGGGDDPENLAFACQGCNNHKYIKVESLDPATGLPAPLFHPRLQAWDDHFIWSHDFTQVVGLTASGRATVEALRLNRPGLANLRRVLYEAGEHPPAEESR